MKILTMLALGAATLAVGLPSAGGALAQTAQMRINHTEAVQDQIQGRVANRNSRRIVHARMVQNQIDSRVDHRDARRPY